MRHDAVVWGLARGASKLGAHIHQGTAVTGIGREGTLRYQAGLAFLTPIVVPVPEDLGTRAEALPLVSLGGGDVVHDWNYLLRDRLDWAEPLGETVFLLGIVTCTTAIGMGIYVAVQSYRQTSPPT